MSSHLNEQDQVEIIKRFWKKYGNWILAVIIIIALAIAGWRFWQKHQQQTVDKASLLYQAAFVGLKKHQAEIVEANTSKLQSEFASTTYASMASLLLAKQLVAESNLTLAKTQLIWVIRNTSVPELKAIAKLRLARILIEQHQAKKARIYLVPVKGFEAVFYAVQGQAYQQMKQIAKARIAYTQSLQHMQSTDPLYSLVEMSKNALPASPMAMHMAHPEGTK